MGKRSLAISRMSGGVGPRPIITHAQRVCRLYKAAYRQLKSISPETYQFCFDRTVLRARFDESNKVKDMRVLAQMLENGEKELWDYKSFEPFQFKGAPLGEGSDHGLLRHQGEAEGRLPRVL